MEENKKKSHNKNRPPTKRRDKKPTPSLPIVALRKEERNLLIEMSNGKRINVNGYSNCNKIPRSTTRTRLKKLDRLGLIDDKEACKTITKRGIIYLENTNQIEKEGVGNSRQEGRKNQLSTHWHKFILPITDKTKFREISLERLNHKGIKENNLPNLHQVIVTLDDAKIIINPKKVIISLYDVVTENVEDSDIKCLSRAVEYAEKLKSLGLETSGIMVEKGHWARIESDLADWLYRNVDERYYLELSDGSKFYIDCSGGKPPEDEATKKQVRENIDKALNKIGIGDVDLSDINKIKDSLGSITEFEAIHTTDNKLKMSQISSELNNVVGKLNEITEANKDTALGLNALTNFTKSKIKEVAKQPDITENKEINLETRYTGYFN